jgi:hypothetical protein
MCHERNNCRSVVIAPDGLIQRASVPAQEMLPVADLDPERATHAFLRKDAVAAAKAFAET